MAGWSKERTSIPQQHHHNIANSNEMKRNLRRTSSYKIVRLRSIQTNVNHTPYAWLLFQAQTRKAPLPVGYSDQQPRGGL